MNATIKTSAIETASMQKAARIAGIAYFLIIITSILSMIIGPYKLFVEGDITATYNNIKTHELLFRGGIVYDLIMYASVVILSLALYVVLKTVNRNLALLGLLWRLGEAILGCLTVLCSLVIILLIQDEQYTAVFGSDMLQGLVGLLHDISSAVLSMVMVFLSLGTIVNCYLFFKSGYIPGVLAISGILVFSLMFMVAVVDIITPIRDTVFYGIPAVLAILFEIVIGLWLWIKGVKVIL